MDFYRKVRLALLRLRKFNYDFKAIVVPLRTFLPIFCCFIICSSFAQEKVNDISEVGKENYIKYKEKNKYYFKKGKFDSSAYFGNIALEQAKKLNKKRLILESYTTLAQVNLLTFQYNKSDSLYHLALELAEEDSAKLKIYLHLGTIKLREHNIPGMWDFLQKGKAFYSEDLPFKIIVNYKELMSSYYYSTGEFLKSYNIITEIVNDKRSSPEQKIWCNYVIIDILRNIGLTQEAINIYENSIIKFSEEKKVVTKPVEDFFNLYVIIGLYNENGNYQKAKEFCYKSIALKNATSISQAFGYTYYQLGLAYQALGQIDSAEYAFKQGEKISLSQNEPKELFENYTSLCQLYYDIKDFKSAKMYGDKAMNLIAEREINEEPNIRPILAEIYAKEKNIDRAYELISNAPPKVDLNPFIQAFFKDKVEKEKQIKELEYENEKQEKEEQLNYIHFFIFIFGLLLFGLLWYLRQKNIKNDLLTKDVVNNKIIEEQTQKLSALNDLRSKLFTNIAHEINTPLTLIKNPARKLLEDPNLSKEHKQILNGILMNSNRLLNMSSQIRELSKDKVKEATLEINQSNLNNFIEYIQSKFFISAKGKGIEINFPGLKDIPDMELLTDYRKLETILCNLLLNALKYTAPGGKIELTINQINENLIWTVKDTGRGIAESDIPFVFERYYQGNSAERISEGGIGIGLAIAKEYTNQIGGTIEIKSQTDKGSEFTLTIPNRSAASVESVSIETIQFEPLVPVKKIIDSHSPTSIPVSEKNIDTPILVVEDDNELRKYIVSLLSDEYDVIFAANGRQAMDLLERQLPKLIITDLVMPIMGGIELINSLKKDERFATIPIVVLTSDDNILNELKAFKLGTYDYIRKPFDEPEFKAIINNILNLAEIKTNEAYDYLMESELNLSIDLNDDKKNKEWLENLEKIVGNSISDVNLSVNSIADKLGITSVHLNRKLKSLTGFSTHKYINEIRLLTGRRMIKNKEYDSVKAVAYSVGFNSEKVFSRNFKTRFGKIPSSLF